MKEVSGIVGILEGTCRYFVLILGYYFRSQVLKMLSVCTDTTIQVMFRVT